MDQLKYRIPGKEIIEQSGYFRQLQPNEKFEGFFLSDFKGDKLYLFDTKSSVESVSRIKVPFCISKEDYLEKADGFLNQIVLGNLGKAVLSRVKEVDFSESESDRLFSELELKYPNAMVYLIRSNLLGTWVGATPERLLEASNGIGSTVSLAGTLPLGSEDTWGSKEIIEQRLVSEFIIDTLNQRGATNIEMTGPDEVVAGPVRHLKSVFTFKIGTAAPLEIALSLHPTPAVSGLPRDKAFDLIDKYEDHDRELYSGMIGLVNSDFCDLYVNLRCCKIINQKSYLFLGGGYTMDSDILKEWEETENKSKTLLQVMGSIQTDQ